jgi:hypothetical protein
MGLQNRGGGEAEGKEMWCNDKGRGGRREYGWDQGGGGGVKQGLEKIWVCIAIFLISKMSDLTRTILVPKLV